MANILMINVPYAGHTNPTLPLAEALARRGHRVAYINAEEFRAKTEKTGAEFIPYKNYPASPTPQQKKTKCFRAAFDTAVSLNRKFDLLSQVHGAHPQNSRRSGYARRARTQHRLRAADISKQSRNLRR